VFGRVCVFCDGVMGGYVVTAGNVFLRLRGVCDGVAGGNVVTAGIVCERV
jgi:hypothetical protein